MPSTAALLAEVFVEPPQLQPKAKLFAQSPGALPRGLAPRRRSRVTRAPTALWRARAVADDDRLTAIAPDDEVVSRQLAGRVEEELARLPETQRVAFELLRVDGLSHDEAAEVLGTTVSAVKLRAFRAYSAIRAVLGRVPATSASEEPRRKA